MCSSSPGRRTLTFTAKLRRSMIVFYSRSSGAQDFKVLSRAMSDEEWGNLRNAAAELLVARGSPRAAEYLHQIDFHIYSGTNVFQDDFAVLFAVVPIAEYVRLAAFEKDKPAGAAFANIAGAITEIGPMVRHIAAELDSKTTPALVEDAQPRISTEVVERALRDAQQLLRASGAVSAVDRVHTALHAYLRALCDEIGIPCQSDASLTELFKRYRDEDQTLRRVPHSEEVNRVFRALATIVDSIGTLRNRGSVAHPNETLLAEPEAVLVINCARTILHYLDARVHRRT